jgi:hypothetical protein
MDVVGENTSENDLNSVELDVLADLVEEDETEHYPVDVSSLYLKIFRICNPNILSTNTLSYIAIVAVKLVVFFNHTVFRSEM